MIAATTIEAALSPHLPSEVSRAAPVLAQVLADALTGAVSPLEAQARLAVSPSLASALHALAGREVAAGSVRIAFGAGSQVGDVSIGDVAGGSMIKLTLSAGVIQNVSVSGQATVGSIIGVQHNYHTSPSPEERERALRALLHDHSGFITSRMEAFVGREAELAEIRERISEKLPTGGYITITGQAGQGKSSVIAKLVADAAGDLATLRERLLEPKTGVPICHFIPFSPGPDHQVGLLRNLIARLCLTHGLPDFYAASDSRPALRDYFAAALRELAKQGQQEIIFIDGLDQIEEDASGVRDLSFLPEEPSAGIVFVLGTRPNDTLKPLELRKPQHEYWLPALSRADFDRILQHRGVLLTPTLADRFYAAMQENALYLDLVARELAQAESIEPEQIIARVADNPANLFSLSIERLQRNERLWDGVLRPILGLLLAARAPLSQRALRALIGADDLRTQQGLQRLGGLIQRDGEGRYGLFHLKLGEFLRQELFATDEADGYHQQLVDWCEGGKGGINVIWQEVKGDALEQERRAYARQHYVAHLAAARSYERLWKVIDAGEYGRDKRRYDLSTRSYALDLDITRQTVFDAVAGDVNAQARALPRLWHYSLIRCSLTSKVDRYPEQLFLALVALGRSGEAINLAELLSDPLKKANMLRAIGAELLARGNKEGISVLHRSYTVATAIPQERWRDKALASLTQTLAAAQRYEDARATADAITAQERHAKALVALALALAAAQHPSAAVTFADARATSDAIPSEECRAQTLAYLAQALAATRQPSAMVTFIDARTIAETIPDEERRDKTLRPLVAAFADAQLWDEAYNVADAISNGWERTSALIDLAYALATAQRWDEAYNVADAIPDRKRSDEALKALAIALAAAQCWDEARRITNAISYNDHRTEALTALATALAATRRWDEARTVANAIPDQKRRADALGALATALAAAQHPAATMTFAVARTIADAIPDQPTRSFALTDLVTTLTAAQRWDEARTVADTIPDQWKRAEALCALVTALATAQHPAATMTFAVARTVSDTIPYRKRGDEALCTLVVALAKAQCWDEARTVATTILDQGMRAEALSNLAAALATTQHPSATTTFAAARTIADTIPDQKRRAEALHALAADLATARRWGNARTVINAITDEWERTLALSDLVATLAATQHWDEARTIANAIPNQRERTEALYNLATALTAAQCWDKAHRIADIIPDQGKRSEVLHNLVDALAAAQHLSAIATFAVARIVADACPDQWRPTVVAALATIQYPSATAIFGVAHTIANNIPDQGKRSEAMYNLMGALAAAQRWDEARAIVDAIPYGWKRTKAQYNLATALAVAQRWDEARTIANAIPNQRERTEALCNLATALATARRWDEAHTVIDAISEKWGRIQARLALVVDHRGFAGWPSVGYAECSKPTGGHHAEAIHRHVNGRGAALPSRSC